MHHGSKRQARGRYTRHAEDRRRGDHLSSVVADLESDAGWLEAVAGCAYVLHVASPLPPGVPRDEDELIILYFGVVDVRDVADLHIRAMTDPAARGERFLASAGDFMSLRDIAGVLKRRMGAQAARVPTRQLPNWLVRIAALRDPAVKQILPELGKIKNASNAKARRMLGWVPRSNEEAIVATAESLVRLGLLKDSALDS
jgi:hypothetical protein